MAAKLDKKEKNTVEFTITVSKEKFGAAVDEAFKKNVKKITVPGFRKGKAPRKLIEKTYGEGVFYEEAVDALLPDAYEAAVKEMGIPLESAIKCATMNPTKAIGIYDTYGSLTEGKQADVVLLDEDLEIKYIIKSGEVVYGND